MVGSKVRETYKQGLNKAEMESKKPPQEPNQDTQQDAAGWACQHALSPVSNITVEVWACSYSPEDEAETIVTDIIAKAAEK